MKLRFSESLIQHYANRYEYPRMEQDLLRLSVNGHLTKYQLRLIARWTSPLSAGHIEQNGDEYIKEVSTFAFSAKQERARIETLTLLDGVSWPTASVILHLFHREPYPVLDVRALWSLGADAPSQYTFPFWWRYVEACRDLAKRNAVPMRTLGRALWQYSKEHQ